AEIEKALVRHKVIFFRDQGHLTDAAQEAFAARLGDPIIHPTVPALPGSSTILELNSEHGAYANSWHTDVTFVPGYPRASILRGVTIPEAGGDTIWANTETAYNDLPDDLQALADGLKAIHTNVYDYASRRKNVTREEAERFAKVFASTVYETEHPLVRVHPVSGNKSLLLGHFYKAFVGLSPLEGAKLFEIFQSYVTRPENTVRWGWREGDVAIWDNRATQHYAVADYGTQKRVVRRVTLRGDVPVGLDGSLSRQIRPEPQEPLAVAAE
ncbi:MAG: TauD/TfdA family dioxygenase, partial [Asticcacaulis sp.]